MSGNVWEWCQDHYAEEVVTDRGKDYVYTTQNETRRVCRGSSWHNGEENSNLTSRGTWEQSSSHANFGFRLVLQ